jgi:hypothetical protein
MDHPLGRISRRRYDFELRRLNARIQNRTGSNGYSNRWLPIQSGNPAKAFAFAYAACASTPAMSRIKFGWENSSRASSPAT